MSAPNDDNSPTKNTTRYDPRPPARSGCLAAFLIGLGVVLQLPGICALGFASTDRSMLTDPTGLLILIACLAIAAGGGVLIWLAVRQPR
jgi:hypothetical protein